MSHAGRLALLVALGSAACTISSEDELGALGASLGRLPVAATAPKLPTPSPTPTLPAQVCPGQPDLAVQAQTADNRGYKDWLYVCTPVKNQGGAAWASDAAQLGVRATANSSGSGTVDSSGFASLATGSTIQRCGWMRMPGLLRMGHDTAKWGECQATLDLTSSLSFDPDIRIDGNEANDDCLAKNNARTKRFQFMAACPW